MRFWRRGLLIWSDMTQSGSANCPLGGSADPVADGGPVVDPGHAASNQSLECPESFFDSQWWWKWGDRGRSWFLSRRFCVKSVAQFHIVQVQVVHYVQLRLRRCMGLLGLLRRGCSFKRCCPFHGGGEGCCVDPILWAPKRWLCEYRLLLICFPSTKKEEEEKLNW